MGERLDYLMQLTMFNVLCPECGAHGKGRWVDRTRDVARCTRCGATFTAHDHTWRPVTGCMTEDERREYLREQQRARYKRSYERKKERYRTDASYRAHVREIKNASFRRWYARNRKKRRERTERVWKGTNMGKKDTLGDLTDHLFMELERLNDEDMTPEQLEVEITRAKAISGIAQTVINSANVVLRAAMFQDERMDANGRLPRMLTDGEG